MDARQELIYILRARLPGVHLRTFEERRAMDAIRGACMSFFRTFAAVAMRADTSTCRR